VSGTNLSKILRKSKIKMPKIKILKDEKHFWVKASSFPFSNTIKITTRAWKIMDPNERTAMILHEVYHLHSIAAFYYILAILTLASVCVFVSYNFSFWVAFLINFLIFRIPFLRLITYISFNEEFLADRYSAERINKKYLISALRKVSTKKIPLHIQILYFVFVKPCKTHPNVQERIKKVRQ